MHGGWHAGCKEVDGEHICVSLNFGSFKHEWDKKLAEVVYLQSGPRKHKGERIEGKRIIMSLSTFNDLAWQLGLHPTGELPRECVQQAITCSCRGAAEVLLSISCWVKVSMTALTPRHVWVKLSWQALKVLERAFMQRGGEMSQRRGSGKSWQVYSCPWSVGVLRNKSRRHDAKYNTIYHR